MVRSYSDHRQTEPVQIKPRWRIRPLALIGAVILIPIGSLLLLAVGNWWRVTQDDWSYGRPRTYQTAIDVGRGEMSYFTVENLDGHIVITEKLLGNLKNSRIYDGPTLGGEQADLTPATIKFADTNGDSRLDLLLEVQGIQQTWLNDPKEGFKLQGGGS